MEKTKAVQNALCATLVSHISIQINDFNVLELENCIMRLLSTSLKQKMDAVMSVLTRIFEECLTAEPMTGKIKTVLNLSI